MTGNITYIIDRNNRIEFVGGDWTEFAQKNDGDAIADPATVIGTNVLCFFSGLETQNLFQQVFDTVRSTEKIVDLPFRCDAPDVRRYMRLTITPLFADALRIDSMELRSEERQPFEALQRSKPRGKGNLSICSVCRRIGTEDNRWVEPETAMKFDALFAINRFPTLTERICHDCSVIVDGCRYILTGATDDPSDLPAVVFLHGVKQGEGLLRLLAPPRLSVTEEGLGYRLISPIVRDGERILLSEIDDIVSQVIRTHRTDMSRVYGTGISSGAAGIWNWAIRGKHPLAAVVPVSSTLTTPTDRRSKLRGHKLPVWAFSGANDPIVPVARMQSWYQRMKEINPKTRMTIYDSADHQIWAKTYANPNLWQWMFEQQSVQDPQLVH